jgi:hypothetical protein
MRVVVAILQHAQPGETVAEVFVEFVEPVSTKEGVKYIARACGSEDDIGHWQGWLEFIPIGPGDVVRSGRETTQPNRMDTEYWATGLTPVYLEGALNRALNPLTLAERPVAFAPAHDRPAPSFVTTKPGGPSILNPFSVYRKGETLLRRELSALAAWHLVNIIRDHGLSKEEPARLTGLRPSMLVDLIVTAVQDRVDAAAG